MSGIGEAIAIVSCVAGLIQALDSGSKIFRQIKARRQAHGALPPSDALEETIENGKRQIEQVVARGNARFGHDFEAGDDTAELALLRITNQIQNALLQRLTLARTDDGVIDFDECIDLSDQGCNDALVALQALYQRKLTADIERKKQEVKQREDDDIITKQQQELPEEITPPTEIPQLRQVNSEPVRPISRPETTFAPQPNERRKRGLGSLFPSKSKQESNPQLSTPIPSPQRRDQTPITPTQLHRTSTTSSQNNDISEISKLKSRPSLSSQDSNPAKSSHEELPEPRYSWSPNMSRASTLATISSDAIIENFGGCCKYSHLLRERGEKAGLQMINTAMYTEAFVYQCKSIKCCFSREAVKIKGRWEVDDTVHTSCNGIQYRWLFLAKSHVQVPKGSTIRLKPFKCLICLVLNRHSETYLGANELFSHISQHRERRIGDVKLEGPLKFSNQGANVDKHFDINLPCHATPLQEAPQEKQLTHTKAVVPTDPEVLKHKLEEFALDRNSKSSSLISYDTVTTTSSVPTDPSFNPWND